MQAGSSLTYYRDVMVYNGNTLSYVLHPEGIIRRSGTAWVYDYMLPGHTGSTRVLLEANGNALSAVQATDCYPFGLSFANNNLDKNMTSLCMNRGIPYKACVSARWMFFW